MKLFFITILVLSKGIVFSQNSNYLEYQTTIDSLKAEDQKWRKNLAQIRNGEIDSSNLDSIKKNFDYTDSLNLIKIKQIYSEIGYPSIKIVGENSNHNYYLLVLHADEDIAFQKCILREMKKELKSNGCSKGDYAYLTDRIRINCGKGQIYGTQIELNAKTNMYIPKKMKKINNVDKRREEMEIIPASLEEYIQLVNQDLKK